MNLKIPEYKRTITEPSGKLVPVRTPEGDFQYERNVWRLIAPIGSMIDMNFPVFEIPADTQVLSLNCL